MCAYIDTTYILDTCFMYECVHSCVVCVRDVCVCVCTLLLVGLLVEVGEAARGWGTALVSERLAVSCYLWQPAMYFILIKLEQL